MRTEENFLTYGNLFSYVRKFPRLRTSIFRLPHGAKFSCARKKISFRKKIYFLAEEKIFSCGRKFGCLPKKNFPPFEQKFCAVRKERNFRAHENKFPHMRKYFFVYTEILPLANPLGMRGVRRGGIRAPSEGLRRGRREAFVGGEICLPSRSIRMDCQLNEG